MNKYNRYIIALIPIIIFASGCSPISVSDEQKKQIVAADPSFEKTLILKNQYDSQLSDIRTKFLIDKNSYESRVAALRKDFEVKRTQFYADAANIKSQLNPQRDKLKSELLILTEDYRNKSKAQKAIKDMLNQAKAITSGKLGTNLAEKDKAEWNKRLDSLTEEYSSITQEVVSLRDKLNILKLKHRSLIQ